MRTRKLFLGALLFAGAVAMTATAAPRMVGVVPSDGIAMLVKSFSLSAGTTIVGVEFENNDSRTVFPEVVLVRGTPSARLNGEVVARATNVSESATGWIRVSLTRPVQVSTAGTYYVGVRIPEGTERQGLGSGTAIGATDVANPTGCFLASGPEGDLTPIGVDLSVALLVTGTSKTGETDGPPEEVPILHTFLHASMASPSSRGVQIEFGLERRMRVELYIYDVTGREVAKIVDEALDAGPHVRQWSGSSTTGHEVAAGVYLARLRAGVQVLTRKFVLAR